jgi:hypothetical protein
VRFEMTTMAKDPFFSHTHAHAQTCTCFSPFLTPLMPCRLAMRASTSCFLSSRPDTTRGTSTPSCLVRGQGLVHVGRRLRFVRRNSLPLARHTVGKRDFSLSGGRQDACAGHDLGHCALDHRRQSRSRLQLHSGEARVCTHAHTRAHARTRTHG